MISVIVPAYNAAATLGDCLNALLNQTMPRESYEILVVDDGSTDDTAVITQSMITQSTNIQLLRLPQNRGAAAARNQGLAAAQGEIICFTDADCEPRPDWLEELTRPLLKPDITATKGIYATRQRQLVARFVQIEYEDRYDRMAGQPQIDFIDTYAAAYRRQPLQEVGGFDETIAYVEDQELSFRLAAQGCVMLFCPTAVVSHHHSHTIARYARKKFWIGCWKARIISRFPDRAIKDSHTPQLLKVQMGLAALLLPLVGGTVFFPPTAVLLAAVLLIFLLTTLPFCRKAWAKDKSVALAAPFLLLVRAFALGAGFVWGTIRGSFRHGRSLR
jgi:glycosyltransferase involved in cell wall biosynthesis